MCLTWFALRRHAIRSALILSLPWLLASPVASAASATSTTSTSSTDYLNPYATDVGRAIAPETPPRTPLDLNSSESPACRDMRIQLERARNAPPPARTDVYPEGPRRDGMPNLSRHGLGAPPPAYGPLQQLENRYRRECLK